MKFEDRQNLLNAIAREVAACRACPLHQGRIKTVPGDGAVNADLMFIGEAPGYHEDQQGLPFVGASGQYLEELLALIGLRRGDVFIANVIKCRPPDNRDPLPGEINACQHYLDRQIDIIDPLVIATLGRFSMARYFPDGKISKIHGQPKYDGKRYYYPLFHPAAVLRNPNLRPVMVEDFKRMADLLKKARDGRLIETQAPAPKDEPPPQQLRLF